VPEAVPATIEQLRRETGRRLRDAVCAVTDPQATETLVLEGDPAGGLVDLSEETELLVLGKSSLARHRRVSGSTTRYCLLHAHCPVVLVPEEASPGFTAPAPVDLREGYVGSPRTPQAELVTTGLVTTGLVTTGLVTTR
jgi:hypothetical protein